MAKEKELPSQEADEIHEALKKVYQYVTSNIKFVSVIAGGMLAGALIILAVFYQMKQTRIKNASLMNQAVAAYHQGQADQALEFFNQLTGKQGVTGAAAALYQGNVLFDQGKYEEALGHYEKARDLSMDPALATLRGLAFQGIAYTEIAQKEYDKAEETLQNMGVPFEDLSRYELWRLYNLQGQQEKASRVLDELVNDFPDSPWTRSAEALK